MVLWSRSAAFPFCSSVSSVLLSEHCSTAQLLRNFIKQCFNICFSFPWMRKAFQGGKGEVMGSNRCRVGGAGGTPPVCPSASHRSRRCLGWLSALEPHLGSFLGFVHGCGHTFHLFLACKMGVSILLLGSGSGFQVIAVLRKLPPGFPGFTLMVGTWSARGDTEQWQGRGVVAGTQNCSRDMEW